MLQEIANEAENGFEWLDITGPSSEELMQLAKKYNLHPSLVKDCLQPDHLPKYERMDNYSFIIFRVHLANDHPEADSVQELTSKIAIFYSERYIITIHRKKLPTIDLLVELMKEKKFKNKEHLFNSLISECLKTYGQYVNKLSEAVDHYEEIIFLKPKEFLSLRGLYHLKRKIDVLRRMLLLSSEIIDAIDYEEGNVYTRETRDQYVQLHNIFDSLSENIHQLLNIYFSTSSQRTNETMRVLTIFSVFFMPLTFIVGIYGMNFEFMPELRSKVGYPAVMVVMAVVTLLIYIWFKKKRWL
jgi:magnesium transporter